MMKIRQDHKYLHQKIKLKHFSNKNLYHNLQIKRNYLGCHLINHKLK